MKVPNRFTALRDAFLAGLFQHDYAKACSVYSEIFHQMIECGPPAEEDQKALNQVQRAFHRYSAVLKRRCADTHRRMKKELAGLVRRQCACVEMVDARDWKIKCGLTERLLEIVLPTVSSLQLSSGCSNFCRRCNEWALPGVRKHFSYAAAIDIFRRLHESGNTDFSLYGASDPLDWRDGDRTIVDLIDFLDSIGVRSRFGLLTKLPRGSSRIVAALVTRNIDFAVSVTARNRDKMLRLQKQNGVVFQVQHDTEDLLIPAGQDEDFRTVKSSTTDNYGVEITPDGAYITIPTFTSALNPTGQFRQPIYPETECVVEKRTGREALLVAYFKPLRVVNCDGEAGFFENLLDPQVENLLLDGVAEEAVPPGMMGLEEFFRSFDPEAVNRRKTMFPTVVRRLRSEVQTQKKNVGTADRKKVFHTRVDAYARFCRKADSIELRRYAVSFLLDAVRRYVRRNPDRSEIVVHLRRGCKQVFPDCLALKNGDEPALRSGAAAAFFFHRMAARLLADPEDGMVNRVIGRRLSRYDSATDMFVPQL